MIAKIPKIAKTRMLRIAPSSGRRPSRAVCAFAGCVLALIVLTTSSAARAQQVFNGDPVGPTGGVPYPMMPGLPLVLPGSDDDWNTGDDSVDLGLVGDVDLVVRVGQIAAGAIPPPGGAATVGTVVAGGGGTGQGAETQFTVAVSDGTGTYGQVLADPALDGRPAIVFVHADLDGDGAVGPTAADGTGDDAIERQEAQAYVGRQVGLLQGGVLSGSVGVYIAAPASMGGLRVALSAAAYTGSDAGRLYTDGTPIFTLWPYFPPLDPTRVLGGGSPPLPDPELGSEVAFEVGRLLLPASDHPTLGGAFALPLDGSEPTTDSFTVVSGPVMGARLFDEIDAAHFRPAVRPAIRPAPGLGGSRALVLPIGHVLLPADGEASTRSMRLLPVDLFGNVADPPAQGSTVTVVATGSIRIVSPDADGNPLAETLVLTDAAGETISVDDAGVGQGWLDVSYGGIVSATTFVSTAGLVDSDGDGVADDGDGSGVIGDRPCTEADVNAGIPCDDNCPFLINPSQFDHNFDGVGDCCDGTCVLDPSESGCNECSSGLCGGGLPTGCSDGDPCTTDWCDPSLGCSHEVVDCSDGDPCTVNVCDAVLGCVAAPLACDDGDPCTTDSCGPGIGCSNEPIVCDDGDLCTTDRCDAILGCTSSLLDCDDQNVCTLDSCAEGTCLHEPDPAAGAGCTPVSTTTTTLPLSGVTCGSQPAQGCFGVPNGKAILQAKRAGGSDPQLRWTWRRGDATSMTDLVDASGAIADYAVCLYDGAGAATPLYSAILPGDEACQGRPCWSPIGDKGVKYADRGATAAGVTALKIVTGAAGKSKLVLKARGGDMAMPAGPLDLPLTMQVLAVDGTSTRCWEATYEAAKYNTSTMLKAVAP